VITVTGGKLTAWRPMAEDAIDAAVRHGGFGRRASKMKYERLAGAASFEGVVPALRVVLDDLGLDPSDAERLYDRYGSLAAEVLRLPRADATFGERLHPLAPYMRAEAEYAIASEMACTAADVMERRLRVSLTTRDRGEAALAWMNERLEVSRG
jgi:glycerol-3-phosphate dehydrogenase